MGERDLGKGAEEEPMLLLVVPLDNTVITAAIHSVPHYKYPLSSLPPSPLALPGKDLAV